MTRSNSFVGVLTAVALGTVLMMGQSGCIEHKPSTPELTALQTCFYIDERCDELTPEECRSIDKCGICSCACASDCMPGESICSGDSVSYCTGGGDGCYHWGSLTPCPNGCQNGTCTCQSGACIPDGGACTLGTLQCNGNTLQQCLTGSSGLMQWFDINDCPNGCQNGSCVNDPGSCTPDTAQCNGNTVQQCRLGTNGTYQWIDAGTCPNGCQNGSCVICTENGYTCQGKTLKQCVKKGNAVSWETVKTCKAFCKADIGKCKEDLPACKLTPGARFLIRQWTDGDTLWIVPKFDGTCNDEEYSADDNGTYAWRDIRFDVRVEGIDAPECTKAQNSFYYYTCIKDSKYTNDNERMGYDSWNWASQLLPFNAEIIVSCEKTLSDGSCGYDATRHRRLAYIGYERNNASYDFATEIAREGLAFANVEFASTTSKIGEICAAQKEAISAKRELWSLAPTVNGVLALMGRDKQRNLKNLESRCNAQMK